MSNAPSAVAAAHESTPPIGLQRGLAFGFLALLPLFCVYEIALRASGGTTHNAAEFVLSLPLSVFGARADVARVIVLCACTGIALWTCYHAQLGLVGRVLRVAGEGALGAILLGPVLLLLQHALSLPEPTSLSAPANMPPIALGLFHFSGAAFEEIVFRVGLQSALYVLGLELVLYFTASRKLALGLAEAGSIAIAAVVFAAAHLRVFVHALGAGGDEFDPAIFAWRVLAGILLGILFRWRGPGVAGWTHGLFNLALFIGASPDVFL